MLRTAPAVCVGRRADLRAMPATLSLCYRQRASMNEYSAISRRDGRFNKTLTFHQIGCFFAILRANLRLKRKRPPAKKVADGPKTDLRVDPYFWLPIEALPDVNTNASLCPLNRISCT